eukprot:EG_transcript_11403
MAPLPPLCPASLAIQQAVYAKTWDQPNKPQPPAAEPSAGNGDEIRLALEALQAHPTSKVALAACGAMQDLLLTEQDCQAALDADVVPILTSTLLHYGASATVTKDSLSSLLLLAAYGRAQALLLQRDVLPALLFAARQHAAQRDIAAVTVALLAQLAATPRGRLALFESHAVELTISSMLAHPSVAAIQRLGCEVIVRVADGPLAQQRLLAMGAAETVVEAVRRFPHDKKLQLRALPTLCRLCEAEQAWTAISQVGGVTAILRAVYCHHEDPVIAHNGCTLLLGFTSSSSARRQIATGDVKELVKKILSQCGQCGVDRPHTVTEVDGGRP